MERRKFLKAVGVGATGVLLRPVESFAGRRAHPSFFGLHPFIEAHPDAVFIKKTGVSVKTDSDAKKQEGLVLAGEIFTLRDTPGIPLSHRVAIKPNLTCVGTVDESSMGIITDCDFVEGVIAGLKGLGVPGDNMFMREGNWLGDAYCPGDWTKSPYTPMAERMGVHLTDFPSGRQAHELSLSTLEEGTEVTWVDCPDGVVFKRIGYVAPFNQPDAWLLNISKFKAHGMGLTLCVKNQQGMVVSPHVHFCEGVSNTKNHPPHVFKDFQPDLEEHVEELHAQHSSDGVPRWDKPGRSWNSGYGMEMWCQRTCDSLSVTDVGLAMIEGIYGRNGNGFMKGPGPGGKAQDFMTNVLIFGKNPFLVDIIGHWLGGHEPGNFGLFHIARDRGLVNVLDPKAIPVYLWEDGVPALTPLEELERYPLVTYYLQRDYAGQTEPYYHLVDEPYDYGSPLLHGDVTGNGKITPYDATWVLQHAVGLRTLTGEGAAAADVSGMMGITAYDASLILGYVVGKISAFPVEQGGVSDPATKALVPLRTVSIGEITPQADGHFGIPILIDEMEDVLAGEITLSFSGNVADITVSTSELTSGYLLANNVQDGRIRASFAGAKSSTGPGPVLEVVFDVSNVEFLSTLRLERVSLNEGRVPVRIEGIGSETPMAYRLAQNYPNPFNPGTAIEFEIPEGGAVELGIYNTRGQKVRGLVDAYRERGRYQVEWDGRDEKGIEVSAGVYLYHLRVNRFSSIKKMTLLK